MHIFAVCIVELLILFLVKRLEPKKSPRLSAQKTSLSVTQRVTVSAAFNGPTPEFFPSPFRLCYSEKAPSEWIVSSKDSPLTLPLFHLAGAVSCPLDATRP